MGAGRDSPTRPAAVPSENCPAGNPRQMEAGRLKLCNDFTLSSVDSRATHHRRAALKSLVIGALIVAVAVLGYLYWDSRNNTIFKAPGIEIKKN